MVTIFVASITTSRQNASVNIQLKDNEMTRDKFANALCAKINETIENMGSECADIINISITQQFKI